MSSHEANPDHQVLPFTKAALQSIQEGEQCCFLCGAAATTDEHIFPRWLQKKFNLWDMKLHLLNGSLIPYRKLKVPCCKICNTSVLSQIEKDIVKLSDATEPLKKLDRLALGRWLAKILIALLVLETRLNRDRAKPQEGPIVPPKLLDDFHHTHLILQSARKPINFNCLHGNLPFSLYTYEISEDSNYERYDFATILPGLSVAIRFGRLGAIFVADGGLQMEFAPDGPFNLMNHSLHPLQFSEIVARIHYQASLRNATHFYVTSETPNNISMTQHHVESFSGITPETGETRIFREWDEKELAHMLCRYLGYQLEDVFDDEAGQALTFLLNADGSFRTLPI